MNVHHVGAMDTGLLLQWLVVGGIIAAAFAYALWTWLPGVRKLSARLILRWHGEAAPATRWSSWAQKHLGPQSASCADGCATCGQCAGSSSPALKPVQGVDAASSRARLIHIKPLPPQS